MIIRPSRHFDGSDLTSNDSVSVEGVDVQEILKEIIGPVLWISDNEGFCECPGAHLHTTGDSRKDCKLYLQPVPTLSCFHSSCKEMVQATSTALRRALADVTGWTIPRTLTSEQKAEQVKIVRREALRRRAATSREQILRSVPWPSATITATSKSKIPADAATHWREIMGLYAPDDLVWAGSIYHSGKPSHEKAFRRAEDWLKETEVPGQFTCPSTFKPGSFSRGNASVERRPYLVVESDELDRDSIAAVFRWVQEKVGIPLRAIVDTAGKSLHGWFEYPSEADLDDLRIVLPELGCDPKMFGASQPCRLPGALRDGKMQTLIYLNKKDQQ